MLGLNNKTIIIVLLFFLNIQKNYANVFLSDKNLFAEASSNINFDEKISSESTFLLQARIYNFINVRYTVDYIFSNNYKETYQDLGQQLQRFIINNKLKNSAEISFLMKNFKNNSLALSIIYNNYYNFNYYEKINYSFFENSIGISLNYNMKAEEFYDNNHNLYYYFNINYNIFLNNFFDKQNFKAKSGVFLKLINNFYLNLEYNFSYDFNTNNTEEYFYIKNEIEHYKINKNFELKNSILSALVVKFNSNTSVKLFFEYENEFYNENNKYKFGFNLNFLY